MTVKVENTVVEKSSLIVFVGPVIIKLEVTVLVNIDSSKLVTTLVMVV